LPRLERLFKPKLLKKWKKRNLAGTYRPSSVNISDDGYVGEGRRFEGAYYAHCPRRQEYV